MRASTQWRRLQQFGRAFTASHFPPASKEATLESWNKIVARESGIETYSILRTLHPRFKKDHSRKFFSISDQSALASPKLHACNPNQVWKQGFKETPSRTHVSSAQSSEPECWDTQEELPEDPNRMLREREWDHDQEEDLRRDRKVRNDVKMTKDDDGVDWSQQHVRIREYETRQRASLSPNPLPKFQQDDTYIPVKACYISRRGPGRGNSAYYRVSTSSPLHWRPPAKETPDPGFRVLFEGSHVSQALQRQSETEPAEISMLTVSVCEKAGTVAKPCKPSCVVSNKKFTKKGCLRGMDLKRLSEEPFLEVTTSRNNLIIRFTNRPADAKPTSNRPGFAEISRSQERFMVAFQYGSIVFFNFGDDEEEEALSAVRKFCTDEFRETRKDDYGVLVRPTLSEWSQGGQDRIMLRMLDTDNIRVISSILGQSIALDHYAKKVDEMVNTFSELNRGMEKTGTFTMTRKSLFQLVAAANTTLADVILRLGLLERSDTAWKDANYAQIWEYLRDDFELDERFESLDFKLNIIQHNVRFFLEILQNRKSDTLEWIIILLISGEICVGVYQILLETNVL